jgi:hypothetical protein
MLRGFLLMSSIFIFLSISCEASEKVIWKGKVSSEGTPSRLIELAPHHTYKIKVSGFVNLGKWIQNGEKLANDACFEFNKEANLRKIEALKNSINISVCDGTYHQDHVYESHPFIAKENRIFFWIYDTNYEDNSGEFEVQLIEILDEVQK